MVEMLRQLATLAQLHQQLLPRVIPQPGGWQLAAHYSAGIWPGRDFYDVLPFADGRVLFLIAHASDHGAASTALTLMVRSVLHSCPLSTGTSLLPFCPFATPMTQAPHVLLGHLSRVLAQNKLEEQFMTAFCGVLDPVLGGPLYGSFHYANAGHHYPRWWQAAQGRVVPVAGVAAPPLGAAPSYQLEALQLQPGDLLVLYCDSLIAAGNERGESFGCERLDGIVREAACQGAEAVRSAVLAQLEDFLAGKSYPEVTFVIIKRQ